MGLSGNFQTVSEEEFSETRLQIIERLCAEASNTPRFPSYRHRMLPQDVVVLDGYAGRRLARPRSHRGRLLQGIGGVRYVLSIFRVPVRSNTRSGEGYVRGESRGRSLVGPCPDRSVTAAPLACGKL